MGHRADSLCKSKGYIHILNNLSKISSVANVNYIDSKVNL